MKKRRHHFHVWKHSYEIHKLKENRRHCERKLCLKKNPLKLWLESTDRPSTNLDFKFHKFFCYNVYLFPCEKIYIIFLEDFAQNTDRQKKTKQKQADYEQDLYRPLLCKYRSLSKTNVLKSLLIDRCYTTKKDCS